MSFRALATNSRANPRDVERLDVERQGIVCSVKEAERLSDRVSGAGFVSDSSQGRLTLAPTALQSPRTLGEEYLVHPEAGQSRYRGVFFSVALGAPPERVSTSSPFRGLVFWGLGHRKRWSSIFLSWRFQRTPRRPAGPPRVSARPDSLIEHETERAITAGVGSAGDSPCPSVNALCPRTAPPRPRRVRPRVPPDVVSPRGRATIAAVVGSHWRMRVE